MKRYFSDLFVGGKSLVDGLGVTLKALCQPMVTVQYPREEIDITPNFRGHIDLILDPEKNTFRCIACGMCERSCPSECIQIKGKKVEGKKKKRKKHWPSLSWISQNAAFAEPVWKSVRPRP